ncbi:MAG: hypothetical protein HN741_11375 [Anaerolineae bacterium]|nr:hypothetical protein [Anaerolineae bacterium]
MPIPYLLDGDIGQMRATYEKFHGMTLENIVQGHGEVILRGEVAPTIDDNLNYLNILEKAAKTAMRRKAPMEYLAKQDVEKCGKSRIILGGLSAELHQQNLEYVYNLALEKAKTE